MLRITFERVSRRMSMAEVSALAGVSDGHLCNIERGRYRPSPQLLELLARLLGVTPPEALLRAAVLAEEPLSLDNLPAPQRLAAAKPTEEER